MSRDTDSPPAADRHALPFPLTREGRPRRVGVEIEFGNVTEDRAAEVTARALGGRPEQVAQHDWIVRDTCLGDLGVELDTQFRKKESKLIALGVEIAKPLVPVEIVTPPIEVAEIATLDRLCDDLRKAGASGSGGGVFLGFGVHFNVEIRGDGVEDLLPVLRAYALTEDWLRQRFPIDTMRWLLPFVDRYPAGLQDALAVPGAGDWSLQQMTAAYLSHVTSRNHGLDLLPLLTWLDADAVTAALGPDATHGGRPTWHFRLPDCRLDEPGWSLFDGWRIWQTVERVAADPDLVDRLAAAWRARRRTLLPPEPGWPGTVGGLLRDAGIAP